MCLDFLVYSDVGIATRSNVTLYNIISRLSICGCSRGASLDHSV